MDREQFPFEDETLQENILFLMFDMFLVIFTTVIELRLLFLMKRIKEETLPETK
jgi:hypothetical protein